MKKLLFLLMIGLSGQVMANSYDVSNTNDGGGGSLRQAIEDANSNAGLDTILFTVSGTINLNSDLTFVTDEVFIDGFSSPNYVVGTPAIIINGSGGDVIHFTSGASNSVVRGLSIRTGDDAFELDGTTGIQVYGCWVGLSPDGLSAANETWSRTGVKLSNGSSDNTIGGETAAHRNVICVVDNFGIRIEGNSNSNHIEGNYIGLTANGLVKGNNQNGIIINESHDNMIGDDVVGARNVVCGSIGDGIRVEDGSLRTIVKGNFIGIAADGATGIGNGLHGLHFINGSNDGVAGGPLLAERNYAGANGQNGLSVNTSRGVQFFNNYSGVDTSGIIAIPNGWSGLSFFSGMICYAEGNLFSGNNNEGIYIGDCDSLVFKNNRIGVDASGQSAVVNNLQGIAVNNSTHVVIGGSIVGEGNLISGNGQQGVRAENSDGLVLQGNIIGLNIDGTNAIPNAGNGIQLSSNSNNGIIGGQSIDEGNLISGNGGNGVLISSNTATLQNNSIAINSNSGIVLDNADGATIVENEITNNGVQGAFVFNQSQGNTFFQNVFTQNLNGVFIEDQGSDGNKISQNSFSCNDIKAINLNGTNAIGVGNNLKNTPTIDNASGVGSLRGTADAGDSVEVYLIGDCDTLGTCEGGEQMQGETYVASVLADANGDWVYNSTLPAEDYTVNATSEGSDNSSEFAICSCSDPEFSVVPMNSTNCTGDNGSLVLSGTPQDPLGVGVSYFVQYTADQGNTIGPVEYIVDANGEIVIGGLTPGAYSNIVVAISSCETTLSDVFLVGGEAFNAGDLIVSDLQLCQFDTLVLSLTNSNGVIVTWMDSISVNGVWAAVSPGLSVASAQFEISLNASESPIIFRGLVESGACSGYTNEIEVIVDSCCQSPQFEVTSIDPSNCSATDGALVINGLGGAPLLSSVSYFLSYHFNGVQSDTSFHLVDGNQTIRIDSLSPGLYSSIMIGYDTCSAQDLSDYLLEGEAFNAGELAVSELQICNYDSLVLNLLNSNGTVVTWMDSSEVSSAWNSASPSLSISNSEFETYENASNSPITFRGFVEDGVCSGYTNEVQVQVDSCCRGPQFDISTINPINCAASDGAIVIRGLTGSPLVSGVSYNVSYQFNGNQVDPVTYTVDFGQEIRLDDLLFGEYSSIKIDLDTCSTQDLSTYILDGEPFSVGELAVNELQICNYDSLILSLSNSNGTVVTWMDSSAVSGVWNSISPGLSVSNSEFETFENASSSPITFRGFVEDGMCSGYTNEVQVQVDSCCRGPQFDISTINPMNCAASDGAIVIRGLTGSPLVSGVSYNVSYQFNGNQVDPVTYTVDFGQEIRLDDLLFGEYSSIKIDLDTCSTQDLSTYILDGEPFSVGELAVSELQICNYDSLILSLSNSNGTVVTWMDSSAVSGVWNSISPGLSVSNSEFETFENASSSPITFRGFVEDGVCAGYTNEVQVQVDSCCQNPQFEVVASNTENCEASDGVLTIAGEPGNPLLSGVTYSVSYVFNNESAGPFDHLINNQGEIILSNLLSGSYSDISLGYETCATQKDVQLSIEGVPFSAGQLFVNETFACEKDSVILDLDGGTGVIVTWQKYVDSTMEWTSVSQGLSVLDAQFLDFGNLGLEDAIYRGLVVQEGCSAYTNQEVVEVQVCLPDPELFIPSAFSPNQDDSFDTWIIKDIDRYDSYQIEVFNRWGSLVYESSAPYDPWDGTRDGDELPMGTYFYVVHIDEGDISLAGSVSILR